MITAAQALRPVRAVAIALVLALPACSSAMFDQVPTSLGGLPEGVPQRPATPPPYPAVHDMPPSRQDVKMSDAERQRLADELAQTRDRVPAADATGSATRAGAARNP